MKEDEKRFLKDVYLKCHDGIRPRDLINKDGFYIVTKRAWYLLEKWSGKGLYNYGVALDLGWLEQSGKDLAQLISQEQPSQMLA